MWLFNWLCLIISELTQLVSVCWWSPNLLLSSFSKGLILKWPNRRLIVGDLWPSVITYDMLCPHLTPYKAILTIDSLLLLHHQIISQTYPILPDDSRYSEKVFFLALTLQKIIKMQSNWLLPRDKKGKMTICGGLKGEHMDEFTRHQLWFTRWQPHQILQSVKPLQYNI